jgi:hypothetical protein
MPTSSPAPFWKYADIGSTPLKPLAPYEVSPSRVAREAPPQSSSPPAVGKSPPSSPSRPQKSGQQEPADAADEPEEEQGFDLMRYVNSLQAYVHTIFCCIYLTKFCLGDFKVLARITLQ